MYVIHKYTHLCIYSFRTHNTIHAYFSPLVLSHIVGFRLVWTDSYSHPHSSVEITCLPAYGRYALCTILYTSTVLYTCLLPKRTTQQVTYNTQASVWGGGGRGRIRKLNYFIASHFHCFLFLVHFYLIPFAVLLYLFQPSSNLSQINILFLHALTVYLSILLSIFL